LQDRPLLDVQLDEDVEIAPDSRRGGRRIETDRAHRVAERHTVAVAHAIGLTGLEPIGDRASPPEVRVEPAPLFLTDRDALEDSSGSAEPVPAAGHRCDRRDDAEGSVERAAAAYRVDMGAGRYDTSAARSFDPSPHVSDGIAL